MVDGAFLNLEYTNRPLGLWDGGAFCGETIENIRGRQLLLYTDGLNEAENTKQEILGNDRLLELMADAVNLPAKEVILRLQEAVERHRDGATPNDDLTLLCFRLLEE
jgi:sigma-B regulation protein RsbU (phosphoserine phosphatase)